MLLPYPTLARSAEAGPDRIGNPMRAVRCRQLRQNTTVVRSRSSATPPPPLHQPEEQYRSLLVAAAAAEHHAWRCMHAQCSSRCARTPRHPEFPMPRVAAADMPRARIHCGEFRVSSGAVLGCMDRGRGTGPTPPDRAYGSYGWRWRHNTWIGRRGGRAAAEGIPVIFLDDLE